MTSEKPEALGDESEKWVLEKIHIDSMANVPLEDGEIPASSPKESSLENRSTSLRKRKPFHDSAPKMGRIESGAKRGLMSLRFLDRAKTGKEEDAWKAIEKRFHHNAVGGRLFKDKFGVCIGIFLQINFFCGGCVYWCRFDTVSCGFKGWETARNLQGSCSRLWRGEEMSPLKMG